MPIGESLWLIDKVEPWLPDGTSFKYLGKTPKHFLADPALSARLLDITPDRLLQGTREKTITGAELRHLHEYRVVKLVINSGPCAYTRKDGVHIVPLALLGP
ncbi:hypothetical protein AGMMS49944_11140 [Spirochaetia bacterium]|nr:hypothetical protein AGMMS49944_11140 [Spirochaetia bacterium]